MAEFTKISLGNRKSPKGQKSNLNVILPGTCCVLHVLPILLNPHDLVMLVAKQEFDPGNAFC